MGYRLAADGVAIVHLCAILFAALGSFAALRWRWLVVPHLAVFLTVVAINLAGADCPLTDLEKSLRRAGGEVAYSDGYIAHYLVHPIHSSGVTPTVSGLIGVLVVGPALLGYLALALAAHRHRSSWRASRSAR